MYHVGSLSFSHVADCVMNPLIIFPIFPGIVTPQRATRHPDALKPAYLERTVKWVMDLFFPPPPKHLIDLPGPVKARLQHRSSLHILSSWANLNEMFSYIEKKTSVRAKLSVYY